MTSDIQIRIPKSIEKYVPHLIAFFVGMVHKLDKNSHKNTPTKESIQTIIDLLVDEVIEFERQVIEDKFNENSFMELVDTANFAFLAYVALKLEEERETRIRDVKIRTG